MRAGIHKGMNSAAGPLGLHRSYSAHADLKMTVRHTGGAMRVTCSGKMSPNHGVTFHLLPHPSKCALVNVGILRGFPPFVEGSNTFVLQTGRKREL